MQLETSYVSAANCFVNLPPRMVSQILDASAEVTKVLFACLGFSLCMLGTPVELRLQAASLILALHWTDESGYSHQAYVGWTGGASGSASTIEVPTNLAVAIGLPAKHKVLQNCILLGAHSCGDFRSWFG
jgi:hypothetical protein